MSSLGSSGVDASTTDPLFVAQWTTCAYPVSDIYASSPRYLYYALLVAAFFTHWHPWLANIFLGTAATYAGTAAIEAFILVLNQTPIPDVQEVAIPYVNSSDVQSSSMLGSLLNLYTDTDTAFVQPAVLELDIDAILAIVVTGYLMMLPMHCWSTVVKAHRIRQILVGLWNVLMLAGSICALVMWPKLYNLPLQLRFCYPEFPDMSFVTSSGGSGFPDDVWQGNWNSTIWAVFSDSQTVSFTLSDNCLYPCFNTSQILRQRSSLTADVDSTRRSPRTDYAITEKSFDKSIDLANTVYFAVIFISVVAIILLLLNLTGLRHITRVPTHRPMELLGDTRKQLFNALSQDIKDGLGSSRLLFANPDVASQNIRAASRRTFIHHLWCFLHFWIDVVALLALLMAAVLTPIITILFVIWIEWYIHRDLNSSESPQQVGQWTSSVSIALVLVSAVVLRCKYRVADLSEIEREKSETEAHLKELEALVEARRAKERKREQRVEWERQNMGEGEQVKWINHGVWRRFVWSKSGLATEQVVGR